MFTSNIRAQLTPGYKLPKIRGDQAIVLEENFKQNRNPNDFEISLVSAEAGMSEGDVKVGRLLYLGLSLRVVFFPRSIWILLTYLEGIGDLQSFIYARYL